MILNVFCLESRHQDRKKKFEIVKIWPEQKSVKNIQIFFGFRNFYREFIRNFNKIAVTFISIL